MILVDTSIWVDHLRSGNAVLAQLLNQNRAVMHSMVLGELACGNLQNRQQLLRLWQNMDFLQSVSHDEALYFIERHALMGKGIGFVDVHLLASVALVAGTRIWTRAKRLGQFANDMGYAWKAAR